MGDQTGGKNGDHSDLYGLKISDLLNHLPLRKTPPSGHLPVRLVILGNASSVHGNVRRQALLPDSIQRLSGPQYRRRHHQTQPYKTPAPNPALHTSNPTQGCTPAAQTCVGNKPPCSLSPDSFFLPYLAARQTELCCDSLSSIRELLLKGELCPDVGGVCERSEQRRSEPWRREPVRRRCGQPGLAVVSGRYFEDIRELQWMLYKRLVWTLPSLRSGQRDRGVLTRTLSHSADTSLLCCPPLVCRTNIYYSAFSPPR
ncbi:uncharacterized protein LOC134012188 [Osmerus eperlanus]|uniref:uncharacterized protein LOC134012188 n=1 Tax=Osmerus eperlanus TaxID=29151 RepID=UPI002E15A625